MVDSKAVNRNVFTLNIDADKEHLTVVPQHPGATTLELGDTVQLEIGSGWGPGDDPYVWRLHLYAPNASNTGPDTKKSQGAWQCDCLTFDSGDPLTMLSETRTGWYPQNVTLANREILPIPKDVDHHWLTGRIAWGLRPADPCSQDRTNLTFDPELINRAGTPLPSPSLIVRLGRFLFGWLRAVSGWWRS